MSEQRQDDRMKKVKKTIVFGVIGLGAAGLLILWLFCTRGLWLRGERYQVLNGELDGHDVRSPVTVVHDRAGVPHIYGDSEEDACYALGYVMARDRFFQMDLVRRLGRGELCELLGMRLQWKGMGPLRVDKLMRTFQYAARAKGGAAALDMADRQKLEAFIGGINSYLEEANGQIPEYKALRVEAEPWCVEDIFVCFDIYGLAMNGYAFFEEYFGARLVRELGPDKADVFFMVRPEGMDRLMEALASAGKETAEEADSLSFLRDHGWNVGFGSNNWVVSGENTLSGKPIVSNDPHVPIAWVPTYWYHAHLSCPSYDALGMFFPGTPFIGAGTNGYVAWGITNARCDMIDVFREKLHPDDSDKYLYNGEWRGFDTVTEDIPIKGTNALPFAHRRSVHGPIIDEAMTGQTMFPPPGEVWSLHLSEVEWGQFVSGYFAIPQSKDAISFREAVSHMSMGPVAWNTVYGTKDGDFGYLYAGHAAYRGDLPGNLPRPGTGEADWGEWIPFDELPHRENPDKGFFNTSNNNIEPEGFAHYISSGYHKPSRGDRVAELLEEGEDWTVKNMLSIQLDVRVKSAERFVPLLLKDMEGEGDEKVAQCRKLLAAWRDGCYQASLTSRGTGVYLMMMDELYHLTFEDELGPGLTEKLIPAEMGIKALWKVVPDPGDAWFDDDRTNARERRKDLVLEAARTVFDRLSRKLGPDPKNWEWSRLQRLYLWTPLSVLPWNRSYRVGDFPHPGTEETVSLAAGVCLDRLGYVVLGGPTTRMSVDMAEPGVFHFCCTTGNAEYPASPFFRNTTDAWREGRYLESRIVPADRIRKPMAKLVLSR